MFKVIVERPRRGSRWIESAKLDRDRHRDGGFVGLRRYAQERSRLWKGFNENLAPLDRFLRSRCGRPWDEVYAEICATLDTSSTVKMHVRQHLDDLVHRRITYGSHGELLNDGRSLDPRPRHSLHDELYVDPDDGILKDAATFWGARGRDVPSRRAVRNVPTPQPVDLRRLAAERVLWRRDGCWFLVVFDQPPTACDEQLLALLADGAFDSPHAAGGWYPPGSAFVTGSWSKVPPPWRVVSARQLGKRELRRYGLTGEVR